MVMITVIQYTYVCSFKLNFFNRVLFNISDKGSVQKGISTWYLI